MMRRSTVTWFVLAVATGVTLYVVKHQVTEMEVTLAQINDDIVVNQEAIHVLQAEWSYLNQPARLSDLGQRLLKMEPVGRVAYVRLDQVDALLKPADEPVPATQPDTVAPAPGLAPKPAIVEAAVKTVPMPREKPKPARAVAPTAPTVVPGTEWLAPILATLKQER